MKKQSVLITEELKRLDDDLDNNRKLRDEVDKKINSIQTDIDNKTKILEESNIMITMIEIEVDENLKKIKEQEDIEKSIEKLGNEQKELSNFLYVEETKLIQQRIANVSGQSNLLGSFLKTLLESFPDEINSLENKSVIDWNFRKSFLIHVKKTLVFISTYSKISQKEQEKIEKDIDDALKKLSIKEVSLHVNKLVKQLEKIGSSENIKNLLDSTKERRKESIKYELEYKKNKKEYKKSFENILKNNTKNLGASYYLTNYYNSEIERLKGLKKDIKDLENENSNLNNEFKNCGLIMNSYPDEIKKLGEGKFSEKENKESLWKKFDLLGKEKEEFLNKKYSLPPMLLSESKDYLEKEYSEFRKNLLKDTSDILDKLPEAKKEETFYQLRKLVNELSKLIGDQDKFIKLSNQFDEIKVDKLNEITLVRPLKSIEELNDKLEQLKSSWTSSLVRKIKEISEEKSRVLKEEVSNDKEKIKVLATLDSSIRGIQKELKIEDKSNSPKEEVKKEEVLEKKLSSSDNSQSSGGSSPNDKELTNEEKLIAVTKKMELIKKSKEEKKTENKSEVKKILSNNINVSIYSKTNKIVKKEEPKKVDDKKDEDKITQGINYVKGFFKSE